MNFSEFFNDCKKTKREGTQFRGTELTILKSLLIESPFKELASHCDYFYWSRRRVAGYLRLGVFAFYNGRYIYISKSQMQGRSKETYKNKILQALRNVISPQIREYRKNYSGNWLCPLSGVNLRNVPAGEIHVDHIYSFKFLVEDWMRENSLTFDEKSIKVCGRVGQSRNIKDEALRESWYAYHLKHARLQLTHSKANIKAGAKRG
jgi:hypothetical protein